MIPSSIKNGLEKVLSLHLTQNDLKIITEQELFFSSAPVENLGQTWNVKHVRSVTPFCQKPPTKENKIMCVKGGERGKKEPCKQAFFVSTLIFRIFGVPIKKMSMSNRTQKHSNSPVPKDGSRRFRTQIGPEPPKSLCLQSVKRFILAVKLLRSLFLRVRAR